MWIRPRLVDVGNKIPADPQATVNEMVELLVNIFMLSKWYFCPTSYIHNKAIIEANLRNLMT